MLHEEIEISDKKYQIKANIKIPANKKSKVGVILAHGGIINRQSLVRKKYSFGEYLCDELDAYVIAPDFQGETIHKHGIKYSNFSEILNITTNYFVEKYNLENVMGFGHSLGCYVLAEALPNNEFLGSIVNYGGPIRELVGKRQNSFIDYLVRYLSTYDYGINIRQLVKYIFDKETCRYLEDVMLKDEGYCYDNYIFDFDSNILMYIKGIIDVYFNLIKEWGNPALLLFGTEDGVTKRTLNFYPDKFVVDNILFKHIRGASHVTPCMDSMVQLSKLQPVVSFYKRTHNITNYTKLLLASK